MRRHRSLWRAVVLSALGLGASACSRSREPSNVVARFDDVAITIDDVDAYILALQPKQRPKPGEDLESWYRTAIRELAVAAQLERDARTAKVDTEPNFIDARDDAEKVLALRMCVGALRPALESITDEDLANAYAAAAKSLPRPERRNVYHLFIRRTVGGTLAQARARAVALRDRVLAGESFVRLATSSSDSETRHHQGSLGWIVPGGLPEPFGSIVFGLQEGVPSEPLVTDDGVQMFYVSTILPAHTPALDEVRRELATSIVKKRTDEAIAELEAKVTRPEGSIVLDRAGLEAVMKSGKADAVVLKLGNQSMTFGELRARTRRAIAQTGTKGNPLEILWRQLQTLTRAELLHSRCLDEKLVQRDVLDHRMRAWQRDTLVNMQRQRALERRVAERTDALQRFYESNVGDFSEPARWHVRLLRLPRDEHASNVMARLERASASSDDLDRLHEELGGAIEDLGDIDLIELRRVNAELPALVAPVKPGALSAPFHGESFLAIASVVSRTAAQPKPFAQVQDKVIGSYVAHHRAELYRELSDAMLAARPLEIRPDALASLRALGGAPTDVAAEDLEELFEAM